MGHNSNVYKLLTDPAIWFSYGFILMNVSVIPGQIYTDVCMNDDDDDAGEGGLIMKVHVCFGSAISAAGCPYHHGYQHRHLCHQHTCCHDAGW